MGSSGTLIGSTLESLGYYYHDWILDTLGGPFQYEVGMLVFLLGVVSVILFGVFRGDYKYARYMLFCPGVFFSIICIREEIPPAEWKFAERTKVVDAVQTEVAQSLISQPRLWSHVGGGSTLREGDSIPNANVSSVFSWYNSLVSNIIQQLTYVILRERATLPEKLFNRVELISATQGTRISDPGLRDMLHAVMMNGCREAFDYAQKAYEAGAVTSIGMMNVSKMQDILDSKMVSLTPVAQNYVAQLYVDYGPDSPSSKASGGDVFNKLLKVNVLPSYDADPLQEVKALKEVMNLVDSDLTRNDHRSQEEIDKAKAQFIASNQAYSCGQIWSLTYLGLYTVAEQAVKRGQSQAVNSRFSSESFLCDLKKIVAPHQPDAEIDQACNKANDVPVDKPVYFEEGDPMAGSAQPWLLYGAIAKYILRNELANSGNIQSAFISSMRGREKAMHSIEDAERIDPMLGERIDQEELEWRYPMEIDAIAASMPYYQGLILCFLGITFPFFAVALLIPGKHGLFLKWFQMWLWAKSWDVGFAIVMLMEQVLFNIFSVTRYQGVDMPNAELNPDMVLAIGALHEIDPSFDMGTYGWIVKTAIVSVPLVLSHLILGVVGAGASLIDGTIQGQASNIGAGGYKAVGMQEIGKQRTNFLNYAAGQALQQMNYAKGSAGNYPDPYDRSHTSQNRGSEIGYKQNPTEYDSQSVNSMKDKAIGGVQTKEIASGVSGLFGNVSKFWKGQMASEVFGRGAKLAATYGGYESSVNKEAFKLKLAQSFAQGEWASGNSQKAQSYGSNATAYGQIPIPYGYNTAADAETNFAKFDGVDQEIQEFNTLVSAFSNIFDEEVKKNEGEEKNVFEGLFGMGLPMPAKLMAGGALLTYLGESVDDVPQQGVFEPDNKLSNAIGEITPMPNEDTAPQDSLEYKAKLDNLKTRMSEDSGNKEDVDINDATENKAIEEPALDAE